MGDASVTEYENDEGESCGDKEGTNVIDSLVGFGGWLVRVDREYASDDTESVKTG